MLVHGLPGIYRKLAFLRSESHSTPVRLLTQVCVCLSVSISQGRESRQKQASKQASKQAGEGGRDTVATCRAKLNLPTPTS